MYSRYRKVRYKKSRPVRNNSGFIGWVDPHGKGYRLNDQTHGAVAKQILKKKYRTWDYCADKRFVYLTGDCDATSALLSKGWVRIAGGGAYSVWSIADGVSRMRRNLLDLIAAQDEDNRIYVDSYKDDPIYNRSAGYIVDQYQ